MPGWLAWPLTAASTLAALGGAALILAAAALGSITAAIWAGIVFLLAAGLWYAADIAQTNREPG